MNGPLPPPDLRARVLQAARAEPMPTRPAGMLRNAGIIAAGMAASLAVLFKMGGPGAGDRPSAHFYALTALWMLVGLGATWAGVARGRSMLGRSPAWHALGAVLTPVALLATALVATLAWPPVGQRPAGMPEHVVCIVFSVIFAIGPLVAFATVRRRSDPIAPRLTGAAIGAASGAWGALCIEMLCTHASVTHVLLGHVVPVIVMALVGLLVGDRVIALRARS